MIIDLNGSEHQKDDKRQRLLKSYKGLAKTVTVPRFNVSGGKSRWFKYLWKL